MHKFLRSIGFSEYQKKRDIEKLLQQLIKHTPDYLQLQVEEDANLCEIRAEVARDMGVAIFGEINKRGVFHAEYYYPYLKTHQATSEAECSIQRHTERETFAGLLDEYKVGISLIFYLDNSYDYRIRILNQVPVSVRSVNLMGLSIGGNILLPVQKTEKQIEKAKVASRDRTSLIEAAKNGDEDAMETLTVEDIDMYSQISRRVQKEDIYSIIDSCFMPCGIECDQYSVLGEIIDIAVKTNRYTQEEIYDFTLDCSDLLFHVAINKRDLQGEPAIGRRFKGQIWMQGIANFKEDL